jgi:lysyl-tRNA synthetase class 2
VSFVVGLAMLAAHSERIAAHQTTGQRLAEVAWGLIGVAGPLRFTSTAAHDVVADVLLGLGATTLLVPTYLALRAPEPTARLSPAEEDELRTLLRVHGERDSLGYFALRRTSRSSSLPPGRPRSPIEWCRG